MILCIPALAILRDPKRPVDFIFAIQVDVTAASTTGDPNFQGKMNQAQAQSQIVQAAKQQFGAGWGQAKPWANIRVGPARDKPHKMQASN